MSNQSWFGPDVEPGSTARRTSRDLLDVEYRSTKPVNSKRASSDHYGSRSPSDNGMVQVGQDGIEVVLVQDFDDATLETLGRWSQAASVGAPEKVRASENPTEFLTGGLAKQSMEDIRVAFAVRGASRVVTHQLVRTRAAAFKQQSQRDSWQGDMPEFRMPESVWMDAAVRHQWINALIVAHKAYNFAIDANVPYQDARHILPEGTTTFILCEYSLRTFMETYAYRGCYMFQQEMVHIWHAMRDLLIAAHPYLEQHLKISCELIHKCTFQGAERVEGQCGFSWARESNRTFRPGRREGT